MSTSQLDEIEDKLDRLVQAHIFDPVEIDEIRRAVRFAAEFNFDPLTLSHMQSTWSKAMGFGYVAGRLGVGLMFIVVLWTNWDRLLELLRGAHR